MKEFNLSEKKILDFLKSSPVKKYYAYPEEDVKKFIKRLKDCFDIKGNNKVQNYNKGIHMFIDNPKEIDTRLIELDKKIEKLKKDVEETDKGLRLLL